MSDRIDGYAAAIFDIARAEGSLDSVEDELFRFARILEGNDDLRETLTDQSLPPDKRQEIVEDLLGGKASALTVQLISLVVGLGRAKDLPDIINRLVERAAAERQRAVAEVRSAVPLDEALQQRLAEALSKSLNKQIEVKVIVDPSVLGGLVTRVGDTVIDGSIRRRLEQLKESL
jgi:F-type H+-transporting ATPase subunit delta